MAGINLALLIIITLNINGLNFLVESHNEMPCTIKDLQ
jgi:hypothetical protein